MTPETVELSAKDGVASIADVWRPPGTPRAAIVMLHGGSWIRGTRASYSEWGPHLARRGILALSLDYRLATTEVATWPGVLLDIEAAVAWCDDQLAGGAVGLMGDSAGGHLVAEYVLRPAVRPAVAFGVVVYGIFEVAEYHEACRSRPGDNPSSNLMGFEPDDGRQAYAAASPLRLLEEAPLGSISSVPLLVTWGDIDPVVDVSHSDRFTAQLARHGVDYEAHRFAGYGHYWFNRTPNRDGGGLADRPNDLLVPIVDRFIDRVCGPHEGEQEQ